MSNGTKGIEHSPGHIFSFFNIKGVMAAVGVNVEEGRDNRDAIKEMPRIQLNSCAVPAFCVGSRSVVPDLHIPHVLSPHSDDGRGDAVVRIKLRKAPYLP